jgi:hypothetical protein
VRGLGHRRTAAFSSPNLPGLGIQSTSTAQTSTLDTPPVLFDAEERSPEIAVAGPSRLPLADTSGRVGHAENGDGQGEEGMLERQDAGQAGPSKTRDDADEGDKSRPKRDKGKRRAKFEVLGGDEEVEKEGV